MVPRGLGKPYDSKSINNRLQSQNKMGGHWLPAPNDNANQAAGIGIDEYDSPQCRTVREKPKSYRVRYNKMEARASINANLKKATGETRSNVMYAMIALRKAAALHAIRERDTK
jgi:hypothetical protein